MANTLIKRKKLVVEIKKIGIKRISPESITMLEKVLKVYLNKIINISKEEMITHGRKTLDKKDIQSAFKKQDDAWEI